VRGTTTLLSLHCETQANDKSLTCLSPVAPGTLTGEAPTD
jgi:hypothetical protein